MKSHFKEDFKKANDTLTLLELEACAGSRAFFVFSIRKPEVDSYRAFTEAVDAYATVIVEKHGSFQNFFTATQKELVDYAASRGIKLNFHFRVDQDRIAALDSNFKQKGAFAEIFLLKLAPLKEKVIELIDQQPQAPSFQPDASIKPPSPK